MIRKNDIVADPKDDYAGALLRRYERGKTRRRRAELAGIVKALRLVLQRSGYIEFRGHHDAYHLDHVGDSYLYHVPENKRGYLKVFRGKVVRIVCVGNHKLYTKELMAGPMVLHRSLNTLVETRAPSHPATEKHYKYQKELGEPNSELNVQRRLRRMRQRGKSDVVVNIPQYWIDEDPALQKAIAEGLVRLPPGRQG